MIPTEVDGFYQWSIWLDPALLLEIIAVCCFVILKVAEEISMLH